MKRTADAATVTNDISRLVDRLRRSGARVFVIVADSGDAGAPAPDVGRSIAAFLALVRSGELTGRRVNAARVTDLHAAYVAWSRQRGLVSLKVFVPALQRHGARCARVRYLEGLDRHGPHSVALLGTCPAAESRATWLGHEIAEFRRGQAWVQMGMVR